MSEIVNVNLDQLVKALMSITGPTPATFEAITDVKMNKTNNPYFNKVTKKQVSNVFINYSYENAVNKRRIKEGLEGDFVAQPRTWGQRVPGTPLVLHKGAYYLSARFLKNEPKIEYMLEGVATDKAVFETYLPASKPTVKSQDVEEPIIVRDFKIDTIQSIKFGGKTYVRTDI